MTFRLEFARSLRLSSGFPSHPSVSGPSLKLPLRIEYFRLNLGFYQEIIMANTLFICQRIPEAEGLQNPWSKTTDTCEGNGCK